MQPEQTSVRIGSVRESSSNPRKQFGDLEELAKSIKTYGLLQPILVRPVNGGGSFEVVFGHRRLRAAKLAGLESIPANVAELTDGEVVEAQIVENVCRMDMTAIEEADAYKQVLDAELMTVDELATKLGKSRSHIYGRLKLCSLGAEGRKAFDAGKLSPSVALLISRLPPIVQPEAVKMATTPNKWNKDLPSHRDVQHNLERDFLLRLTDAPWDKKDTELVAAAGACTACPKRTGAQKELFPEVKSGDVCTDRVCFAGKRQAHGERVVSDAKAKGLTILRGKAAEEACAYNSNYVSAAAACHQDPKYRTYGQLLGKKLPQPVVTIDKNGDVGQVYVKKEISKALKENGIDFKTARSQGSNSSSAYKPDPLANEIRERTELALAKALIEGCGKLTDTQVIDALGRAEATDGYSDIRLNEACGWVDKGGMQIRGTALAELYETASPAQRRAFAITVLAHEAYELAGVDVKAIQKQVIAEVKAEAKEKTKAPTVRRAKKATNEAPAVMQ